MPLLSSATGNGDRSETSSSSSSSSPAPSDAALALASQLQGIWIADYARSSGRSRLLSAMGLSGLQRVTAEKLVEGVSLSVVSGSPGSPSSSSLVASFLTVVPFFNVTEAVPLDGSSVELPRRDLKPGAATISIAVESGGGGGGGGTTTRLVVVSQWEESSGGAGGEGETVSLRETYKLVKPTELHVTASFQKGKYAAAAAAAAVASSTTVYRLDKAWKPRYSFPAQKSSPPSFSDPFSSFGSPSPSPSSPLPSSSRRSTLLSLSSALAATSLLAAPPSSDAVLPPGLIFPTTAKKAQTPIPPSAPLPPAFPRRKLELPLAVLLLRSCYDALDSADLVPMDQFQVDFFKIRSNCWEPYLDLRQRAVSKAGENTSRQQPPRPQQGDLSDPAYFDVIAFSQALTIDSEFRKVEEAAFVARAEAAGSASPPSSGSPPDVFEFVPTFDEYCEAGVEEGCPEAGRRSVVRSSPLALPGAGGEEGAGGGEADLVSSLWREQRAAAGDLIYARLAAGSFRGLEFKGVPKPPGRLEEVREAAEALAKVFVGNGFALKQTVAFAVSPEEPSSVARTAVVTLRLDGPADLWATGALLGARRFSLGAQARSSVPAFAGVALGGLLRASEALVAGSEPLSVKVVGGGTATEVSWGVSERERKVITSVKE